MDSHAPTSPTQPGELPKTYRPSDHEQHAWNRWINARAFHAEPRRVLSGERRPYSILIPPPNVTARLHLGHALNNTLQDILVRAHRMMGFETLWMPGTDHAGIATQAVVEKRLRNSGELTGPLRTSMKRDDFIARAQEFKDEYEREITNQLQRMGCSCDYDRQRFTMDEQCAAAVREAFFRLFKDGLIYRGKRLVNWDCVLQTAVADDECYDDEVDGSFYYLRYPLVHVSAPGVDPAPVAWNELASRGYPGADEHPGEQQAWLTVATTRPETYLGDTAVAVNPHDPRAKSLRGLHCELPLVGRVIPVIEDPYVVLPERYARNDDERNDPKAKMATGFLKVTPAHDHNDYEIGRRHNLAMINVLAPDGTISDRHGWTDVGDAHLFVGRPREHARKMVVKEFDARGLFEGARPTRHALKHSDRSSSVVEPYLSDQWYVKVTDPRMAQAANEVLHTHALAFHPSRYARTYEQWHDTIRDWCISRQLWWGHRIPVWRKERITAAHRQKLLSDLFGDTLTGDVAWQRVDRPDQTSDFFVCVRDPADPIVHALEREGFVHDPDVLDTWFSSALWPLSTMGWPAPEKYNAESNRGLLDAFNPTSTLCTAREIITLWVSRMVMFNRYFRRDATPDPGALGPPPFRDVFIHCVIQDGQGQKMSKSLGNGVDPLDIIDTHGADALRYTLCSIATQTQDVRLPVDLICPHTGAVFAPRMITVSGGYVVPAPIQTSPKDPTRKMVTVYGVVSGQAGPSAEMPLAKNTSSKFDLGRNFANKLWNASRLVFMSLPAGVGDDEDITPVQSAQCSLLDRWILAQLHITLERVNTHLARYEFSEYAQTLYDFVWRDFCDWYLEGIKPTISASRAQRCVLASVLDAILRMLHPVMPFVTETIWAQLRTVLKERMNSRVAGLSLGACASHHDLLCLAPWPRTSAVLHDASATRSFDRLREFITLIRDVRAKHQVRPARRITLAAQRGTQPGLEHAEVASLARTFANLERVDVIEGTPPAQPGSVSLMFDSHEFRLSDLHDSTKGAANGAASNDAERARLNKLVQDLGRSIETLKSRLDNPGYTQRAPAAMVQQTRDQLAKAESDLARARETLQHLGE